MCRYRGRRRDVEELIADFEEDRVATEQAQVRPGSLHLLPHMQLQLTQPLTGFRTLVSWKWNAVVTWESDRLAEPRGARTRCASRAFLVSCDVERPRRP